MRVAEENSTVTHKLLVIGRDAMRMPGRRVLSLTNCHGIMQDETLGQKGRAATHKLLGTSQYMVSLPGRKQWCCHSPSVSHEMRHGETAWQKKGHCN